MKLNEDLFCPLRQLTLQEFELLTTGDLPHYKGDIVEVVNTFSIPKGQFVNEFMSTRQLFYVVIRDSQGKEIPLELRQHYLLEMCLPIGRCQDE